MNQQELSDAKSRVRGWLHGKSESDPDFDYLVAVSQFLDSQKPERPSVKPKKTGRRSKGSGMQLFIVVTEDSHTDPDVRLFSTEANAIAYAKSVMDANSDQAQFVDEDEMYLDDESLEGAGLIFHGTYSTEGDCVWVASRGVDADS